MPNIKKYEVDYDDKFSMLVEIDHDVMTNEGLHEINNFWSEADTRLFYEDGDVLKAVLKLIAAQAFRRSVFSWDVIDDFNWEKGNGQEGFPSMDGSKGIKILNVDEVRFEAQDMSVKAL